MKRPLVIGGRLDYYTVARVLVGQIKDDAYSCGVKIVW